MVLHDSYVILILPLVFGYALGIGTYVILHLPFPSSSRLRIGGSRIADSWVK